MREWVYIQETTPQPLHKLLAQIAMEIFIASFPGKQRNRIRREYPLETFLIGFPKPEKTPEEKELEAKVLVEEAKERGFARARLSKEKRAKLEAMRRGN